MKILIERLKHNTLFGIIIGGIMFGSVVYAASYLASDISYQPTDSSWEVSNVNEALDSLYDIINNNNLILEDSAEYGRDGNHVYTYMAEEDATYLISFATSKAKLNCGDNTTNVSISGYETLDILYDQTSSNGWNYDGGSQLHLYLAKVSMKAGETLSINVSIGNGYPFGKLALLKI